MSSDYTSPTQLELFSEGSFPRAPDVPPKKSRNGSGGIEFKGTRVRNVPHGTYVNKHVNRLPSDYDRMITRSKRGTFRGDGHIADQFYLCLY